MKHLNHNNLLVCICLALVGKSFFFSPSLPDALIFLFTAISYSFNKYLVKNKIDELNLIKADLDTFKQEFKKQSELNNELVQEVKVLKAQLTGNNLSKLKKTEPYKF